MIEDVKQSPQIRITHGQHNNIEKVVLEALSNTALWGQNLAQISPLKDSLTQALNTIISQDKISDAHSIFQNLQ